MAPLVTYFRLPDIAPGKEWPFLCPPNPQAAKANMESVEWLKSCGIIHNQKTLQRCLDTKIDILVAWSYRHAGPAHYRRCSDLMHLFWLIEDVTDKLSREAAEKEVYHVKLALKYPDVPSPPDETILGGVMRSFWSAVLKDINPPPATKARFITDFESYMDSMSEEADDRQNGRLRSVEEHFHLRRRSVGAYPALDFIYMPFELPDVIAEHPHINRMTLATVDLIIIANDVYSWNIEQAEGRVAHNIVDVVMRENQLDVQGAFDYIEGMHKRICTDFLNDLRNMPSFEGPSGEVVRDYVEGLVEWVQGNIEFSLASGRYFGALAGSPEIRKTRLVAIYPPKESASKL